VPFTLFLLCSFVLLARPQDVLTFMQPMRPALVLTVLAMAALVFGGRQREIVAALSTAEAKRYVLFFALMILGIPFAYHRGLAFDGVLLGYTVNMFFFVLLVSHVTSLQRLKSFLWVICLSTVVYSVFGGILQAGSFAGGRFEVMGGVFDANDTAYVLLSLFPLCLYFVQFDAGLMRRLVAIAAICGAVATILLTGSRGGIIAFGAVLLMLLLTRTPGVGIGRKILLLMVLAATWFLMRDKIDIERYLTLSDLSSDYNVTAQGGRMKLWGEALDLSLAHPVTGVGVNGFATATDHVRRLAGESYLHWQAVHNSYLQVAAEVGLIGFALYLLIHLRSLRTFLRLSRSRSQSPESVELGALGALMLLGFTGLMISGFFLSQGYSIFVTLYFALAACLERLQSQRSAAVETSHPPLAAEPGNWSSGYRQ
jgi:O-antigen ligase